MNWKFWAKSGANTAEKQPKPKELPAQLGQHLVTVYHQNPDWVWSLKCAMRKKEGTKKAYDFRVFDESSAWKKKVGHKKFRLA